MTTIRTYYVIFDLWIFYILGCVFIYLKTISIQNMIENFFKVNLQSFSFF